MLPSASEMDVDDDVEELLVLEELLHDDLSDLLMKEVERGATMDNLEDWFDGTGRFDRKGVPYERRWWKTRAHKVSSATFRSWFRCRCVYEHCSEVWFYHTRLV